MTVIPDFHVSWLALPVAPAGVPDALAALRSDHGGDLFPDWLTDTVDPE